MAWRSALGKTLQELRVYFCPSAPASAGAKEFVIAQYAELKKANPHFPILIRDCPGAEAKLTARYDFGVEKSVSVQGLDAKGIQSKLEELVKHGETLPRYGNTPAAVNM